jgi:hypothetical protein
MMRLFSRKSIVVADCFALLLTWVTLCGAAGDALPSDEQCADDDHPDFQ